MAEVVLFHSALGLRPGVYQAAERLRSAGHLVHLPDLFCGRVFGGGTAGYEAGLATMEQIGPDELCRRALKLVQGMPPQLVYIGFSMGARLAQFLATTRPGAAGAILLSGGGSDEENHDWPSSVPVEIHHSVDDPWVDAGAPERLVRSAARCGAPAALHLYPGQKHLFADPSLPEEYDPALAGLMWSRILTFMAGVPSMVRAGAF